MTTRLQLLLCRHGNTFGPDDKVVWVGRRNDLPLVEKGRAQALQVARALVRSDVVPAVIFCGPLARTREYAEIVAAELGVAPPRVDARLDELDYGAWSGLSDAEIVARHGRDELEAWKTRSAWPESAGWEGTETAVRAEVRSFVSSVQGLQGAVLAVSSNGRLRYFLDLVPGELQARTRARDFGVRTGNVCKLLVDAAGTHEVAYWNVAPDAEVVL